MVRQRIPAAVGIARPLVRLAMATVLAAGVVPLGAGVSFATCALDPDDPPLTIRQMIRQGTTGDPPFDVVFLGRVREIRDPGERGGDVVARFSVRAHPVGLAPHRSRVRFYRPPPGWDSPRTSSSIVAGATPSSRAAAATGSSRSTGPAARRASCLGPGCGSCSASRPRSASPRPAARTTRCVAARPASGAAPGPGTGRRRSARARPRRRGPATGCRVGSSRSSRPARDRA